MASSICSRVNQIEKLENLHGPYSGYGYQWRKYRAEVYKAFDSKFGEFEAIKKCFSRNHESEARRAICREIFLLWQIRDHRHVMSLHHWRTEMGYYYLFLDYFEFNLEKFIAAPCTPLHPPLRKKYLQQILIGIAHCHSVSIIHRHLSPRFVLVDPIKETLKISEFGEAMFRRSPELNSRLLNQNFGYRAPEVVLHRKFSFAADVWSVGCIFAAMVRHKPLFHDIKPGEEEFSIFSLLGIPDTSSWPEMAFSLDGLTLYQSCQAKDLAKEYWGYFGLEDTGLDLLQRMLALNPKGRITAEEALKHPYFNETPDDTKMIGKRKFDEISSEHDGGLECADVMST